MTSVARSLAARVAVASAPSRRPERKPPTAASRGRIRGVRAMGYESNIPPTRGQPGRFGDGGGGLILPGDDRYDAGMVKGIPSPSNPGGKSGFDPRTGTGGPGQLPGGKSGRTVVVQKGNDVPKDEDIVGGEAGKTFTTTSHVKVPTWYARVREERGND